MSTKKKPRATRSRKEVAYHEAGHAVINLFYEQVIDRVTILPDKSQGSDGHVLRSRPSGFMPEIDDSPDQLVATDEQVMVCLAGIEAQFLYCHRRDHDGAKSDYREAALLAEYRCRSREEAKAYVNWIAARTRTLLRDELWSHVEAIATALLKRHTLSGVQAKAIYQSTWRKLAPKSLNKNVTPLPTAKPQWPGCEFAKKLPAQLQTEVTSFILQRTGLSRQRGALVHKLKQERLSVIQIAKLIDDDKEIVKAILRT